MESYRHLWKDHFQRRLIQDAMLKSEFLERWSFGQPGWSMPVCEDDRQVGGAFPWV